MDEEQKIVEMDREETGAERDGKTAQPQRREELVVKLKAPYRFEGKDYDEIDLNGLEKLTIQTAVDIQLELMSGQEVAAMLVTEATTAFALALAAKATEKPIEFFKCMPLGGAKKVVNAVRAWLTSGAAENHVMVFDRPYVFQDKEYTQIDLSGVADLNAMHLTEAENRMSQAGFFITENSFNFFYACIIAGMAVKLPEAFFLGLPVRELLKLKAAVNDEDFFA